MPKYCYIGASLPENPNVFHDYGKQKKLEIAIVVKHTYTDSKLSVECTIW